MLIRVRRQLAVEGGSSATKMARAFGSGLASFLAVLMDLLLLLSVSGTSGEGVHGARLQNRDAQYIILPHKISEISCAH